jgi:hypothetical protein
VACTVGRSRVLVCQGADEIAADVETVPTLPMDIAASTANERAAVERITETVREECAPAVSGVLLTPSHPWVHKPSRFDPTKSYLSCGFFGRALAVESRIRGICRGVVGARFRPEPLDFRSRGSLLRDALLNAPHRTQSSNAAVRAGYEDATKVPNVNGGTERLSGAKEATPEDTGPTRSTAGGQS